MIDYKIYNSWYFTIIKGNFDKKDDIIQDFITYKLPNVRNDHPGHLFKIFKNYCLDRFKFDHRIVNNKSSFTSKTTLVDIPENYNEIEDDFDYDERKNKDEDNIKKIEVIISYIKNLPTHERELFKQYYINKVSTRKLALMYDINYNKIYKKVRKYKEDINSLYIIDEIKKDIKEFMIRLASNNYTYTTLDALKITNYHIILFQWKDSKYDEVEKDIYQMIEDIKKEIK